MFYTYRLSFPDGTYYIGSATNTHNRFVNHNHRCKNQKHYNHKVQTAWNTFGEPALQVLNSYNTREEAYEAEEEILNEFYGTEECLNLSSSSRSFWTTKEHRENLSSLHKGKTISVENRARQSAFMRGRPKTAEHREKMKNRIVSPETRAKLSASNTGKTHSPETRAKISISNKGKRSNPIRIGDLYFPSITEAGRFYGVSKQAIHFALKSGTYRGMKIEKVSTTLLTTL